jgi:polyisoprenoid-binding protein YceI
MRLVHCWPISLLLCGAAQAAPVTYEIDPAHTYPSFEADHFGGVSTWRGKFNSSSGRIVLDRDARSGTVEVTVDTTSVDFGHDEMNTHALEADLLDTDAHPAATYRGTFAAFDGERPTRVDGTLTLRGVTRPLSLQLASFKCVPHPLHQRELCGADASATFERDDFGIVAGKDHGFDMTVTLRIQVEAVVPEAP